MLLNIVESKKNYTPNIAKLSKFDGFKKK